MRHVLFDGLFGVVLYAQGKTDVGSFNGFDDGSVVIDSDGGDLQRGARHVAHGLMVP